MAKPKEVTEIIVHDLRALLFWATVGIRQSTAGSYQDIKDIIESYACDIDFKLDKDPEWGADRRPAVGKPGEQK
jgi:hypothetical protein